MSAQRQAFEATVAELMEQAQCFASRWALVDSPFDSGGMLADAESAKTDLRKKIEAAISQQAPVSAKTELYRAAIDCEHIISQDRIELFYDDEKPGNNALNQLHRRLDAAIAQSRAQVVPAEPVGYVMQDAHGDIVYGWSVEQDKTLLLDVDIRYPGNAPHEWRPVYLAAPAVSDPAEADLGLMASLADILDGKDLGDGVSVDPWESLRRRVLSLMAAAPSAPIEPTPPTATSGWATVPIDPTPAMVDAAMRETTACDEDFRCEDSRRDFRVGYRAAVSAAPAEPTPEAPDKVALWRHGAMSGVQPTPDQIQAAEALPEPSRSVVSAAWGLEMTDAQIDALGEPTGVLHRDDGYYSWTKGREPERRSGDTYRMDFFTRADVRAIVRAAIAASKPAAEVKS